MFRFHQLYKAFSGDKNKGIIKLQGKAVVSIDLFIANTSLLETILPYIIAVMIIHVQVFRPENYNNSALCSFFSANWKGVCLKTGVQVCACAQVREPVTLRWHLKLLGRRTSSTDELYILLRLSHGLSSFLSYTETMCWPRPCLVPMKISPFMYIFQLLLTHFGMSSSPQKC